MAKISTSFVCIECGHESSQWLGRCPECQQWNTFSEESKFKIKSTESKNTNKALKITDISEKLNTRIQSGIKEFDRVVGGGIVPGSLILIGGEPGIGKSTLLTMIMGKLSENQSVLYISGEESSSQIASRMKRLKITNENLLILNETNWHLIKDQIKKIKPKFIVLDSIQTTTSPEIQSPAGSVSQIKEVTYELMTHMKSQNITTFVIGHINKEGSIAGPKILEHMVDTVIYFEGDQYGQYRILRAIKNRFGNANEIGIFEMNEAGLEEVENPSKYFIDDQQNEHHGRSLSCILEGSRTLFIEVQALVVENKFASGRRTTQGIDANRLAMLVAVIDKYLDIPISLNDIYLNIVGGVKINSRETDLAVIVSLISSYKSKPAPTDVIFMGEVGLTGEVRGPHMMESRLKEIVQLNYRKILTSKKIAEKYKDRYDVELIGIKDVKELSAFL